MPRPASGDESALTLEIDGCDTYTINSLPSVPLPGLPPPGSISVNGPGDGRMVIHDARIVNTDVNGRRLRLDIVKSKATERNGTCIIQVHSRYRDGVVGGLGRQQVAPRDEDKKKDDKSKTVGSKGTKRARTTDAKVKLERDDDGAELREHEPSDRGRKAARREAKVAEGSSQQVVKREEGVVAAKREGEGVVKREGEAAPSLYEAKAVKRE